jgi:cell division protein FtsW
MASSLNLIPTKGMTLPFISYGGSSLVASGLTLGLILALSRKQQPSEQESFANDVMMPEASR